MVKPPNLPDLNVSKETLIRLYRAIRRIRRVEERVAEIYPSDRIKSPVHLSIGQEAVSAGVCDVLEANDMASGTYRGHALYLAKGGDLLGMMAELFGKRDGVATGKGGSMHLIDMNANVLGTSAVVGTNIPVAMGVALTMKRRSEKRVTVCFFGDGATEEGVFHESLNFASLQRLPILFVCENNRYAIHEPLEKRWATPKLCERVETYGIPAHSVPDQDILEIRGVAEGAVERIRNGGGPEFMECHTYRWREHVGPGEDYDAGYRSETERAPWLENDQITRLAGMIEATERAAIDQEIEGEIDEAIRFAEASSPPDAEELYTHVFS